ncbi:acetyltransferase [Synergistales bacterium]|nr:acetyltransferase [Synergistales bacterium]
MLSFLRRVVGTYRFHRDRIKYAASVDIDSSAHWLPHQIQLRDKCKLVIGEDSLIEARIIFEKERCGARVSIGKRTFIGASSLLCASGIEIGDDVLISFGVTIVDHDSHSLDFSIRRDDVLLWREGKKKWDNVKIAPVKIADRAWIGMYVIVLEGVTIGEGAVVGAGAVVTKDVPPYTVAAGNPARVIREINR